MVYKFPNRHLDHVSREWIRARRAFRNGGAEELQRFAEATSALFAAFTADWKDADVRLQVEAFEAYRDALADDDDRRLGIGRRRRAEVVNA